MSDSEVIAATDTYRLRLVVDDSPDEPYDDGSSPVVRRWYDSRTGWRTEQVQGTSFTVPPSVLEAVKRFDRAALFERFMRIFHGTTQVKWMSTPDYTYVSFDTAAWREAVGAPERSVSLDEWRAYVDGDVYGYVIEQQVTWQRVAPPTTDATQPTTQTTWETVEDCWGFYGHEYALEAAKEAFEAFTQPSQNTPS